MTRQLRLLYPVCGCPVWLYGSAVVLMASNFSINSFTGVLPLAAGCAPATAAVSSVEEVEVALDPKGECMPLGLVSEKKCGLVGLEFRSFRVRCVRVLSTVRVTACRGPGTCRWSRSTWPARRASTRWRRRPPGCPRRPTGRGHEHHGAHVVRVAVVHVELHRGFQMLPQLLV